MRYTFFCFLILLGAGCNALYVPATPATPVFEKGNSLRANFSAGGNGVNANADYTPFNHFYFGAAMHSLSSSNNRHFNLEGHLGYYYSLRDSVSYFSGLAGAGSGNSDWANQLSGSSYYYNHGGAVYHTFFAQAFYAYRFSRRSGHIGFGLRYDAFDAHFAATSYIFQPQLPKKNGFPMAFLFLETGGPQFRFFLLAGAHTVTVTPGRDINGYYLPILLRMGVTWQLRFRQAGWHSLKILLPAERSCFPEKGSR